MDIQREIKINTEKSNKVRNFLLENNLKNAIYTLNAYMDYIKTIFDEDKISDVDESMKQKKINFRNRKCYNHVFDVILNAIEYNDNENRQDLEENIIIAILHDIGRGKEWLQNLNGPTSNNLNHTELGLEYLFDCKDNEIPKIYDYIEHEFVDNEKIDEIRQAIKYHSTYTFPDNLSERKKKLIRNIRFSDKVAIMEQFVDNDIDLITDIFNTNIENFAKQEITDELMMYFNNNKCIDRKKLQEEGRYNSMAEALSVIGFIYDKSNENRIFKILNATNWIEKYIQKFPLELMNERDINKLQDIRIKAKKYIIEQIELSEHNDPEL